MDKRLYDDLQAEIKDEELLRKQELELEEARKIQIDNLIIPNDELLQKEIESFSPAMAALITIEDFKSMTNKEKDELRELNKQLAKNPKTIEDIKAWLARRRAR